MKKYLLFLTPLFVAHLSFSQQNYCDFEGNNVLIFGFDHTGMLDTAFANPAPNMTDSTPMCAKYIRGTVSYDYIKMYPMNRLINVTAWADSTPLTPKITMDIYSTAPAGTQIIFQLGKKSDNNYPSGIHSEYITTTKAQNSWEHDTLFFFQKPAGSTTSADSIDKVVLLFNPTGNTSDTYYFDNLTGPALTPIIGIAQQLENYPPAELYQNFPNPVSEKTNISFSIGTEGNVSLKIYDLLGNSIATIIEKEMKAGKYSFPVETNHLCSGLYFYVLKKDDIIQTKKMIISR